MFVASYWLARAAEKVFPRAGTNIRPDQPSLVLLTHGPFRFSRNPLYLATTGMYVGRASFSALSTRASFADLVCAASRCMGVSPLMSSSPDRTLDYIAAGGLLVGAVFGLAGTFVASPMLQASLGVTDGVAWVGATSLLALRYFRAGVDIISRRLSGLCDRRRAGRCRERPPDPRPVCRPSPRGRRSGPRRSPSSVHRGTYHGGCVRWAVSAQACSPSRPGRIYAGEVLLPTSSPLPFFAYPFLVATLLGWQ